MNIIKKQYTTLKETRFIPVLNLHKNTGSQNDALSAEVTSIVVSFIKKKGIEEGEVHDTRIIHCLTGHDLRDEDKGRLICLRPRLIKRCTRSIALLVVGLLIQTTR
jgi:hypothetical protein